MQSLRSFVVAGSLAISFFFSLVTSSLSSMRLLSIFALTHIRASDRSRLSSACSSSRVRRSVASAQSLVVLMSKAVWTYGRRASRLTAFRGIRESRRRAARLLLHVLGDTRTCDRGARLLFASGAALVRRRTPAKSPPPMVPVSNADRLQNSR